MNSPWCVYHFVVICDYHLLNKHLYQCTASHYFSNALHILIRRLKFSIDLMSLE